MAGCAFALRATAPNETVIRMVGGSSRVSARVPQVSARLVRQRVSQHRLGVRASAAEGSEAPVTPAPVTSWGPGEFQVPTMLNNCPHPREVRQFFYNEQKQGVMATLKDGKTRMKVKLEFPELNVEMDVYRIGTLLEGIRELVTAITQDGKKVKVCVQNSMGAGVFTAMPLQLSGVRRILDMMEWGESEQFVRMGGIGKEDAADDTDVFIVIAPQNITGYSVLPYLKEMGDAAGDRPIVLINPRLTDIPSANNVMQVRGREGRLAFEKSYEEVFHFRLLYQKPRIFPIKGALRYTHGGHGWEVYKRLGKMQSEVYRHSMTFPTEPNPEQMTAAIDKDVGKVED